MAENHWTVPRIWPGETVVCVGGGPSLSVEQLERVRGRARVIVINNAYQLAPWADVLYACDLRWWRWHAGDPGGQGDHGIFKGLKVSLDTGQAGRPDEVKLLENTGIKGFEEKPDGLRTGSNAGYQVINLAPHFGAARILLLGYDMRRGEDGRAHWHAEHPTGGPIDYENFFAPKFYDLVAPLDALGIEVWNVTPGSALTAFPKMTLEAALDRIPVPCQSLTA